MATAHSITEMIGPILLKLSEFNAGANYSSAQVALVMQKLAKSARIKDVELLPDQRRFKSDVSGDAYDLLLSLTCKAFVDPVINPQFTLKKRVPKHQKNFAFELENEIYRLENGEGIFCGA